MNKIVPVRFKGANYMCVDGSDRQRLLNQANSLWCSGDRNTWRDVFDMAMRTPGCSFEHRVMMSADPSIGAEYLRHADLCGGHHHG